VENKIGGRGPTVQQASHDVQGVKDSVHRDLRDRPTLKRALTRSGIVLIGLLLAFVATLSWHEWGQQQSDTQAELTTVTEVGARALDSYLGQLETSLKILAESLTGNSDEIDLSSDGAKQRARDLIQQFNRLHPELTNMVLLQPNGQAILAAIAPSGQSLPSMADEESFKNFPRVAFYAIDVGQPMVDFANGRWVVPVRYRVTDTFQDLKYVLCAQMRVEFFASFWKDAPLTRKASLGVLRDDGFLLSRFPFSQSLSYEQVYGKPRDGTLINYLREQRFPISGSVRGYNNTDSGYHVNVFRRLDHYPLTLFATMPTSNIWMEWWTRVRIPYLLSTVMLLGGLAIYSITSRRQAGYETALNKALREAEQASRELDVALDNMSHGLCMFDADQKIVVANDRYLEIYNLQGRVGPGMTLRELAGHLAERGMIAKHQQENVTASLARIHDGKTTHNVRELPDGRTIVITNRPLPGGGWVATHEDITERRRSEIKLEQTQKFLNAVVEYMPAILSVKHVRTQTYALVNKAASALFGYSSEQMMGKSVHELFPKKQARYFAERDRQAIEARGQPVVHEHAVTAPHNGTRVLNTTKMTILDATGEPEYVLSLSEDITERRQAEADIAHMAHHDALTGLPNRVLLRERLENALAAVRRGSSLAVLYLDLDHFKSINDTLGHSVGDEFLKIIATRLKECARETDTVARLGGDEFVILLTNLGNPAQAEAFARRVREAITTPIHIDGQEIIGDVSIGISLAPNDANSAEQLLKNSDLALYGAKEDGRGTYRFFEPEMDAKVKERRALELDLRKALSDNEFELYYQPLINIEHHQIIGCEALLRWHHPERGMIPPADFIPVAEDTGLITAIGDWVLKTACAEAATWPSHIKVAVNVSPSQFKNQRLTLSVAQALGESGLDPARLEIEITEAVLLQNEEATLAALRELHDLGIRIAMDDFGTGYSSLSYLRSFPFDKIKIDRSFVNDLAEKPDSVAIVRAVAGLANELNMITTVEGVETAEQYNKVREFGCTEIQGFLFSRPIPRKQLEGLFEGYKGTRQFSDVA
jgi:diguanylate cyclase (GGDEF)-like protein/PAS domain S-box-containing protein